MAKSYYDPKWLEDKHEVILVNSYKVAAAQMLFTSPVTLDSLKHLKKLIELIESELFPEEVEANVPV